MTLGTFAGKALVPMNVEGGLQLRRYREELCMTRAEAAAHFEVSVQSIYNYEKGKFAEKTRYVHDMIEYLTDFRIRMREHLDAQDGTVPLTPVVVLRSYRSAQTAVAELGAVLARYFNVKE